MILIYLQLQGDPANKDHWHVYQCPSGGFIFDGYKGTYRARQLILSRVTDDARVVENMEGYQDESLIYSRYIFNHAISCYQKLKGPDL